MPLEQIGTASGHVISVDSGCFNVVITKHEFLILRSSDVQRRHEKAARSATEVVGTSLTRIR